MFLIRMFGSTGAGGIVPNVTQPVYFFPMRQGPIVLNSEQNQWVEGPCIGHCRAFESSCPAARIGCRY